VNSPGDESLNLRWPERKHRRKKNVSSDRDNWHSRKRMHPRIGWGGKIGTRKRGRQGKRNMKEKKRWKLWSEEDNKKRAADGISMTPDWGTSVRRNLAPTRKKKKKNRLRKKHTRSNSSPSAGKKERICMKVFCNGVSHDGSQYRRGENGKTQIGVALLEVFIE